MKNLTVFTVNVFVENYDEREERGRDAVKRSVEKGRFEIMGTVKRQETPDKEKRTGTTLG